MRRLVVRPRIVSNSDRVFWLCIGILLGLLIAYLLAQRPTPPPTEKPRRGKTQPIRYVERPA